MKKTMKIICCILLIIPLLMWNAHALKDVPEGLSMDGNVYYADQLEFLTDLTYEKNGTRVHEQQLFKRGLQIINEAEKVLVVDLFLFNDDYNHSTSTFDNRAEQLTDALIEKKEATKDLHVTVITDPINSAYQSSPSLLLQRLKEAGIDVVETDLTKLKDSNPLYSSVWRSYLQWIPTSTNGLFPNAFNKDKKMSLGAYLDLVNFKANHRKVLLNDHEALIASANISHDGSSLHSNIGFVVQGAILNDLYASENAILKMMGQSLPKHTFTQQADGEIETKIITEGAIGNVLVNTVKRANKGDAIQIGVFYLADRPFINELKAAAKRGVSIQLVLDANRDAFGLKKNGIPNRPVAAELSKEPSIDIRWYDTKGEQYHSKFLLLKQGDELTVVGGSANFTKRNLRDFNLETDLYAKLPVEHDTAQQLLTYYNQIWNNIDGNYTVSYETYGEKIWWKTVLYHIQEFTGLSTF
ncbi:phospholipase D-like domain-containing protein [Kurthia senegalensis]|uniref:phospholipase D-like domain-containing protein n=1 Tax=Kurthia senegalensis TaxID=1033740 RepID=UPI0002892B58|nr:phospholipase D-like domain-containing protein [Kurthia senegalensis]